jgi:hypothetical protein
LNPQDVIYLPRRRPKGSHGRRAPTACHDMLVARRKTPRPVASVGMRGAPYCSVPIMRTINNPGDKFCGDAHKPVRLGPAHLPRDLPKRRNPPGAPRLPHLEGERRHHGPILRHGRINGLAKVLDPEDLNEITRATMTSAEAIHRFDGIIANYWATELWRCPATPGP